MSEIFISYARSTTDQARQIAEALRGLGYTAWRDDELPPHRPYAEVIAERLDQAKAVLVLWSDDAVRSEWVRSEATAALRREPRFMDMAAKLGLADHWQSTDRWPDYCSEPNLPYNCKAEAERAVAELKRN